MVCHKFIVHRAKLYGIDFLVVLFFGLVTALCHFLMDPYDRFFMERDPFLSYPYLVTFGEQEIPNSLVVILVIPVPITLLLLWVFFWRFVVKLSPDMRIMDPILALLAFLEAMVMTIAITEFLKNFVGRKRPNFFAMCNYYGYRDALSTGNFTLYNSLTVAGRPGNLYNCYEKDVSITDDSQYSFPSGHSSTSFCALVYCGMLGMITLHHWTNRHHMLKALLVCFFIWVAAIIAGTRPRDYWHNFDDILAGSIIGTVMALLVVYLNYGRWGVEKDSDITSYKAPEFN